MVRLLLIEDDVIDQYAFQRECKTYGWDCTLASSLQEAHQYLAQADFDLIFADYFIGDGTALDIIDKTALPVIVITGAGDEEIAAQAIKAGAYDYLVKDHERHYLKVLPLALESTIYRQKLEKQAEGQRAFAQALYASVTLLTSTLNLDEVLERILQLVQAVVPHDAATIMLIVDGRAQVRSCAGWATPEDLAAITARRFVVEEVAHLHQMYHEHQPVLIADTRAYPSWQIIDSLSWETRSALGVPIYFLDQVIGFLTLDSRHPNQFSALHAERLQAFAHHAAVAIQNAQLFEQTQQLAALEERQRLARDLHDSVTQTLFSANVMAQSVLRLWERDPNGIRDDLVQLTRFTQGALAEMRTLLLELRPQALVDTDLESLFHQLAETTKSRARLEVDLFVQGTAVLPADVQVAIFRIAQEALNNIIKHAGAQHVHIELLRHPERVDVRIADDGRGFDLEQDFPNHFGLKIMGERAKSVGVQLTVESKINTGTSINVAWTKQ